MRLKLTRVDAAAVNRLVSANVCLGERVLQRGANTSRR